MAIEYLGDTFIPLSAEENALSLLNTINTLLVTNNVLDSDGNQAVFYVNLASPIWLIIFAVGTAMTVFQYLIQAAGNSLSITDCSDQQVLNLAIIAGTTRNPGKKTTVFVTVTATSAGCTISPANLIKYTDDISFTPLTTTVIAASGSAIIETQSTEVGAFVLLPGELNAFVEPVAGVQSIANALSSIPGIDIETITSLRRRIQQGSGLLSSIDSAIQAIRNLSGINHCNIYFNPSLIDNLVIGSLTLGPRQAAIVVYGDSADIAETYLTYMLSDTVGSLTQDYTSLGQQLISVKYSKATLKYFYVKVVIEADSGQTGYLAEIWNRFIPASGSINIGKNYTQQYLINYLDNFEYANVIGLYISMDNVTWSDITSLTPTEIGVLASAYITAEEK